MQDAATTVSGVNNVRVAVQQVSQRGESARADVTRVGSAKWWRSEGEAAEDGRTGRAFDKTSVKDIFPLSSASSHEPRESHLSNPIQNGCADN